MAKVKCDIRRVVGEIGEPNSRNETKAVAFATWNDGEETLNIRKYNVVDKLLLAGINFTPEEAEELIYILLGDSDIMYDKDKAIRIISSKESEEDDDSLSDPVDERETVDIAKMMMSLDDEDQPDGYVRNEEGYIWISMKGR